MALKNIKKPIKEEAVNMVEKKDNSPGDTFEKAILQKILPTPPLGLIPTEQERLIQAKIEAMKLQIGLIDVILRVMHSRSPSSFINPAEFDDSVKDFFKHITKTLYMDYVLRQVESLGYIDAAIRAMFALAIKLTEELGADPEKTKGEAGFLSQSPIIQELITAYKSMLRQPSQQQGFGT